MRILFLGDAGSPHCTRVVQHFRDRGDHVEVASFRPGRIPGVRVHALSTHGLGKAGYFFAIPKIRQLVAQLDPEVVQAFYITSYGFIGAASGARPLVVTAWGTDVLTDPRRSILKRLLVRYALKRADAATAVAAHMLPTMLDLGARRDRLTAIPLGVDTAFFRPADRPQPRTLDVVSIRNLDPVYSVDTVIRACGIIGQMGRTVSLCVAGDGTLRSQLEDLARAQLAPGSIRFVGRQSREGIRDLLYNARVAVSSALSDGNNVSINEAMACGAFPIATDIPANQQWITHGVNGMLYPAADAAALAECLRAALQDGALRAAAAKKNWDIIQNQAAWGVISERLEQLYARVGSNE